MKFQLLLLLSIFLSACGDTSKLEKENQELLLLTKQLTETIEVQNQQAIETELLLQQTKELAQKAAADAIAAQAEAERQADMALEVTMNAKRALQDCN